MLTLKPEQICTGLENPLRYDYKCPWCNEHYSSENWDDLEVHHIIPQSEGGKDTYANMVYLHGDCHRSITALGATNPNVVSIIKAGITKKYQLKKTTRKTKPIKKS